MSMLDQFQKLDDLIVEHTQPPTRAILRNQLALTREQVEAYQAASDKQDQTLSSQAEAIAALQEENRKSAATIARFQTQNDPPSIHVINQMPEAKYEPEE